MNSSFCRLESIDRLNYISILSTGDDSISLLILSILLFPSLLPSLFFFLFYLLHVYYKSRYEVTSFSIIDLTIIVFPMV